MILDFTHTGAVITLVEKTAAIGVIIASLESLAAPATMRDDGLCSWQVHQLMNRWFVSPWFQRTIGRLLIYPRVLGLIALRSLAALSLLLTVSGNSYFRAGLALLIVVISFLLTVRSTYGRDGADQMLFLTFITLFIAHIVNSELSGTLAIWFLALQVCLSYITAGVSKLISPIWRSGAALPGIFGTYIYGHTWIRAAIGGHPSLAKAGCWTVIIFECMFPLALIAPDPFRQVFIFSGIAFHLFNALFMRLNTFFWAFLATYPAVLYCGFRLT
jgi:hypothetical protein